jgi:hypothetical protein
VGRYLDRPLGRRKKREQIRLRTHHLIQPLNGRIEQRRRHELQRIPEQDRVQSIWRIIEILPQEVFNAADIGLFRRIVPERLIDTAYQILRVDLMTQIDEEVDVFLVRSGGIQHRQTHHIADIKKELLQPTALPGLGGHFLPDNLATRRAPGYAGSYGSRGAADRRNSIVFLAEDGT